MSFLTSFYIVKTVMHRAYELRHLHQENLCCKLGERREKNIFWALITQQTLGKTFRKLFPLLLGTNLLKRQAYRHFTEKQTLAQSGWMTCQMSHSLEELGGNLDPIPKLMLNFLDHKPLLGSLEDTETGLLRTPLALGQPIHMETLHSIQVLSKNYQL